jgi:hypothetical protein
MAEGDVSVFNLDELRFFECGVEGLFLVPSLSCFLLVVVVGFGECVGLVLKGVITVIAIITFAMLGRSWELKNIRGGKKTHSVFDGLPALPICISNPNRAKCL